MNVETVREYCLNKKGVTESFPFDDVSLVVKVMNKMFALIDLEEANHIALKCDPEKAIELREHYSGIEGAYHFNKKYWNSVRFESDVDDKLMKELIWSTGQTTTDSDGSICSTSTRYAVASAMAGNVSRRHGSMLTPTCSPSWLWIADTCVLLVAMVTVASVSTCLIWR